MNISRNAAAQDNLEAAAKSVNITMHVADSHNAISRREERIHVNISLLCICSDPALRNEGNHAHLTHCNDSDRPITIGEKKYTCSHTRCISVCMRIEDLKGSRQGQSGGEGESRAARPGNQTQQLANFCCEVCSIHEHIMQNMNMRITCASTPEK
jgi:hypothetical protein